MKLKIYYFTISFLILCFALVLTACNKTIITDDPLKVKDVQEEQNQSSEEESTEEMPVDLVKSAHFVSSQPVHGDTLNAVPQKVTIKFNFVLGTGSTIEVTNAGNDVTSGVEEVSADKLTLSVPVSSTDSGVYNVNYTACWPDKSCHNGSFSFSVK